jgi:hypothetical protein
MHVIGRLDLACVNAECFMVEVEHRYTVADERVPEFIPAPRRDLQGKSRRLAVLLRSEVGVHLPRQVGNDHIRVFFLRIGDAHLVFVGRLLGRGIVSFYGGMQGDVHSPSQARMPPGKRDCCAFMRQGGLLRCAVSVNRACKRRNGHISERAAACSSRREGHKIGHFVRKTA